jgi:ElaB/YqjD/DUF883 family membrane-anchored ribosome-binding protein
MAFWSTSRTSDLQARIDELQSSLTELNHLVGEGAETAGKRAVKTVHAVEARASSGAHDVLSAVSPLLGDLGRQLEGILTAVTALSGSFGGLARKAGKESRAAYSTVETKVEDNAMVAVLAAAGIGFLIGAAVGGTAAAQRRPRNPS